MDNQDFQTPEQNQQPAAPAAAPVNSTDPFANLTPRKVEHMIYGFIIFFMCFVPFVFGGTFAMICLLIAMLMGGVHLLAAFTETDIVRGIAKGFAKDTEA